MKRAFKAFKDLDEDDFRVLTVIEAGLRRSEFVPRAELSKYARLDHTDLEYHLGRVDSLGLIERIGTPYEGYRLLHSGYDFLALNAFVQRDTVESLGDQIAVGKESEVYEALGTDGVELVIKFHRLGISSFSKAARLRGYLGDRRHFSWIYVARLAAEREAEALRLVQGRVPAPEAVDQNRNGIVMDRLEGAELVHSEVGSPPELLRTILSDISTAWCAGIVHGDLSEFNVMVGGGKHAIIDWPQWVSTDHPQAKAMCSRDLRNMRQFFAKKYPLELKEGGFEGLTEGDPWDPSAERGQR